MSQSHPVSDTPSVPIIIAITGHRDVLPDDTAKIREAVRRELRRIASLCPAMRLLLMSGLAEGADRIAAQVALEEHIELLAVLPMPRAEYEKDFVGPDCTETQSLAEFRTLLKQSTQVVELPLVNSDLLEVGPSAEFERVAQYEQLGLYLASNCHLLIALWDGDNTQKRGGASNVVNMRMGLPSPVNPTVMYARPSLPIGYGTQIVTPRQSQAELSGEPYTSKPIIPQAWHLSDEASDAEVQKQAQKIFRKVISNTCEFNADAAEHIRDHQDMVQKSREYLFRNPPVMPADDTTNRLIAYYSLTDSLANRFQKERMRTIVTLFALIVGAFVWFEFHVKVFSHIDNLPPYIPLLGYLILVPWVAITFLRAKRRRCDEKHEDYRVLAESLRVQVAWRLAGMTRPVTEYCLPQQIGELSWIRLALFGMMYSDDLAKPVTQAATEFVRDEWVEDQAKWYQKRRVRQSLSVQYVERFGGRLLVLCAAIAILLAVAGWLPESFGSGPFYWIFQLLAVTVAALLAVAAARHGYVEKMAWAEQAHQYDRMRNLFTLANKTLLQLKGPESLPDQQDVLYMLGKEALREHGDWLIMHRARPLEVPRL